jgi:hypothetical protein
MNYTCFSRDFSISWSSHHCFFFLATGPASGATPLTRATKRKKKQWKGHIELETRFSNGPTKTEPKQRNNQKNQLKILKKSSGWLININLVAPHVGQGVEVRERCFGPPFLP